jgi:hypothetical protein
VILEIASSEIENFDRSILKARVFFNTKCDVDHRIILYQFNIDTVWDEHVSIHTNPIVHFALVITLKGRMRGYSKSCCLVQVVELA